MVLVKATQDSEKGIMPPPEAFEAMGRFNAELAEAGVVLAADGLTPSAKGKRVAFDGDRRNPYTPAGGMTATPVDVFTNNVAYCSAPIAASDACYRSDPGDTWADGAAGGLVTTTPWANVGNTSPGTETTVPNGYNFAITSGNTVGNGVHWNYLLPPHDEDLGACYHTLTSCP